MGVATGFGLPFGIAGKFSRSWVQEEDWMLTRCTVWQTYKNQ